LYRGNRVELSIINPSDSVAEIWLGNDGNRKWSIASRNSYEEYNNLCIYSSKTGGYVLTIGKDDFLGRDNLFEIHPEYYFYAFQGMFDCL
jgi:hypothetical protein